MRGIRTGVVRGLCAAVLTIVVGCSSKSVPGLASVGPDQAAISNAAIDKQIPAVCLKVVETRLACLENKQAVDRVAGKSGELLSDRVQIIQAGQFITVNLHNAIILRGTSVVERECERWALAEITGPGVFEVSQIHAAGGDSAPCARAVDALRDYVGPHALQSTSTLTPTRVDTLSPAECDRLVRRSLFNMTFPPNNPMEARFVAACVAGRDLYSRSLFNCVFASKYSDSLDCAYAARGIDRSKAFPILAARQIGDEGSSESSIAEIVVDTYQGKDPHTTIDQITRDRYLSERDNILRSLGEAPPSDGHVPIRVANSKIVANGLNYWVVHEDFNDLQLVKIVLEDSVGSDIVICARFGSTAKLATDAGYCAALIKQNFHTQLVEK